MGESVRVILVVSRTIAVIVHVVPVGVWVAGISSVVVLLLIRVGDPSFVTRVGDEVVGDVAEVFLLEAHDGS